MVAIPEELKTEISPVEEFLSTLICHEKLALYQPVFDLLTVNGMVTYLDNINLIVENINDDSPVDKLDKIHKECLDSLHELISMFGIELDSDDLKFLTKLYHVLTLLHIHEEHAYIKNICEDEYINQVEKFFKLCLLFYPQMDDQYFYDTVNLVSLSLIDRIREVHTEQLEQVEDDLAEIPVYDYKRINLIRKLNTLFPHSLMGMFIRSKQLNMGMSRRDIVLIITPYFQDQVFDDYARAARELIMIYLLSDVKNDAILSSIREDMQSILNNTVLIAQINSCLNTTFMELMSHEEA